MRSVPVMVALVLAAASGCGGQRAALSEEVVTTLPAGDGEGVDASGDYVIDVNTRSCSGRCPNVEVMGFSVRICTEGYSFDNERATVTQNNGKLDIEVHSGNLFVEELIGGIDGDGSFDVGGSVKELNGAVVVTMRVTGTIDSKGVVEGTVKGWGKGDAAGTEIDCLGVFALEGSRQE